MIFDFRFKFRLTISFVVACFLRLPPNIPHPQRLYKKRRGVQPAGLQHVVAFNHARVMPLLRGSTAAAAAAAVVAMGRARRSLGLWFDDEKGVTPTEDIVIDSHSVQVLLDGEL